MGTSLELPAGLGQIGHVLASLIQHLRSAAGRILNRVRTAIRETTRPLPVLVGFIADVTRSREHLLMENALLRQQLIVASRKVKRPLFKAHERGFVVLLASLLPHWRNALLLVKPDTVLRWHREGFRLFWRWKSKNTKSCASRVDPDVIALIHRMAAENVTWGAERIRGELLKLGIRVAKRTIQRHMTKARPPDLPRGQNWSTFLRSHTVWACDFLQTYDIRFRLIFAFFVVDINSKRVVHVGVTRSPTEEWTAQQLRNITPFGEGPQFIIRDNDSRFGAQFDRVAKGAGTKVLRTAIHAPLMNAVCERFIGSARRECLDHVIILGRIHMKHVLEQYGLVYFNMSRPHQGIAQQIPVPTPCSIRHKGTKITSTPILGGLHNDYRVAA
jgi:putative transposase